MARRVVARGDRLVGNWIGTDEANTSIVGLRVVVFGSFCSSQHSSFQRCCGGIAGSRLRELRFVRVVTVVCRIPCRSTAAPSTTTIAAVLSASASATIAPSSRTVRALACGGGCFPVASHVDSWSRQRAGPKVCVVYLWVRLELVV